MADALSRKRSLLLTLQGAIIDFGQLKTLYEVDEDFGDIWKKVKLHDPSLDQTTAFQKDTSSKEIGCVSRKLRFGKN